MRAQVWIQARAALGRQASIRQWPKALRAFLRATHEAQLAVHLEGTLGRAASLEMQPIDVLSQQQEAVAEMLLELDERTVGGVRTGAAADSRPIEIPAPHHFRV